MKKIIEIGTRFEAIDKEKTGYIYLRSRDVLREQWIYGWYYTLDHSAPFYAHDWAPSYASARRNIPINGKFKQCPLPDKEERK
jgi:hypothetical protein